ncbi:hypothetical protein [Allorhizocola rhizosphaerae]|uniref:hypothetical protein n=1 Tax=Allorhizocola rhizosphaerae TaxID=1872709 RepID=UPI000E3D6B1F|nr:hypothetical protein [Allorhizocola rhizosphaerae]
MRRLIAVLACSLALTVASGCGKALDDGLPTAGGPDKSDKKQVSGDPAERMRQFAQCMRDNGVDMPDPQIVEDGEKGGEGDFKVEMRQDAGPGEAGSAAGPGATDMEKFKKAEEACKDYMPEGGTLSGPADPQMQEKMRQMAKCMRENGFENFPDPQEGGGIAIGPDSGIDPRDPKFREAQKKCDEQAGLMGERKTAEGKPAT